MFLEGGLPAKSSTREEMSVVVVNWTWSKRGLLSSYQPSLIIIDHGQLLILSHNWWCNMDLVLVTVDCGLWDDNLEWSALIFDTFVIVYLIYNLAGSKQKLLLIHCIHATVISNLFNIHCIPYFCSSKYWYWCNIGFGERHHALVLVDVDANQCKWIGKKRDQTINFFI